MSQKIVLEASRLCLGLLNTVLLALADEANDAGLTVDVDIAWIAGKTELEPNTVINALGQLLEAGIIHPLILSGLGRHLKCYQLDLDWPIESESTGPITEPAESSPVHTEAPLGIYSSSFLSTSVESSERPRASEACETVASVPRAEVDFGPATHDARDGDGPVSEEITAFLESQFAELELAHNREAIIADKVAEKVKTGPAFRLLPPGEPLIRRRQRQKYDGPPIPGELFPLMFRVCYLADSPAARMLLTKAQYGRVARVLGTLLKAGVNPYNLPEFEKWWANNYRSKNRNDPDVYVPPRPEQVQELWNEAMQQRAAAYYSPALIEEQDREAEIRISRAIMEAHAQEARANQR